MANGEQFKTIKGETLFQLIKQGAFKKIFCLVLTNKNQNQNQNWYQD